MKFKSLFILLSIFLLLTTAVSADRYIISEFKEGIISESGQLTETDAPLTNVGVLGYVCLNKDTVTQHCTAVGNQIFNLNSGSNDYIQLTYPTELQGKGYAIYYYKPGYITWEQFPDWEDKGIDYGDPQTESTKYLSKKQNCHAPIESFSVINEAQPNIPVYITAQARLDAETYSALFHNGPLEYIPIELQNYYQVQTEVQLSIYDENDILVKFDKQELFIDFSGSEDVGFVWTPVIAGNYKIVLESVILDPKCSSFIEETTSKEITVLSEDPYNTCYTILNDLETSNQFPNIDETLTIYYNKISNYVDDLYALLAVPTTVTYELRTGKDDPSGTIIYSENNDLPASPTTTDPEDIQFNWLMPSQQGWYTLSITGQCNEPICDTIENIQDKISESFYLGVLSNYAPLITSTPITNTLKDELYTYQVTATDQDNDPLTYTLTNAPTEMTIDSTGTIQWIPTSLGVYNVAILVDDNNGGTDTQIYNIEVTLEPKIELEKKHLFSVGSISIPTNTYHEGDIIDGIINLRNIGQKKEKNIAVTASILDLGVETIITQNLKLGQHDNKWLPFELELPYNLDSDEYLLRIEVRNKHHTDIKYLPIYIKDKFIFNF